ncbi:ATP phosphoribosyltransferase [bacterium]|nr:ATP phosphoribosyltransferase [bacterium]
MSNQLTIGIPKGSLEESTLSLFAKAGFRFYGSDRSFWLTSNDPELKPVLLRPQEIPLYVANGELDCGLAGWDWIIENSCDEQIRMLADLCYSKRSFRPVRWVLAVSNESSFRDVNELKTIDPPIRISTELKMVTESWLSERGIIADVSFSWGATEAKVPVFADAIVECTETGVSLLANGLRILDTVLYSTTRFFANKKVYKSSDWKRGKLDGIALLLKSCLVAETKTSLHAQVPNSEIEIVKALIPSEANFSVWEGQEEVMLLEIIIDKDKSRELVPVLARNGARKISLTSLGMLYE